MSVPEASRPAIRLDYQFDQSLASHAGAEPTSPQEQVFSTHLWGEYEQGRLCDPVIFEGTLSLH